MCDNTKPSNPSGSLSAGVLLSIVVMFLYSCAWMTAPPEDQAQARLMLEKLTARNSNLTQIKTLVQLTLKNGGKTVSGRAAVAAKAPNHLRVQWLSTMGQPISSLAGDGKTITIRSYTEDKMRSIKQSRTALERFIHIPMGIEDLIALLLGRAPLPVYAAAMDKPSHSSVKDIVVKNRWHSVLSLLRFDASGNPELQEIYNPDASVKYRIQWLAWMTYEGYILPKKIRVETASDVELVLTAKRYWTDIVLPSSTFILQLPPRSQTEP